MKFRRNVCGAEMNKHTVDGANIQNLLFSRKFQLSDSEEKIKESFPKEMQPLAARLLFGAYVNYLDLAMAFANNELCSRIKNGGDEGRVSEIMYSTALTLCMRKALVEASFRQVALESFSQFPFDPFDPQHDQKPALLAFKCFDSRENVHALTLALPGDIAIASNIGGSLEDHNDWRRISVDAKEAVTYANHIKRPLHGQPLYLYPGHTSCGCIKNAHNDHPEEPQTEEEKVIKAMAERKSGLVSEVAKNGTDCYINMLQGMDLHGRDRKLLASEIAHTLYNAKLIGQQYHKLTGEDPEGIVAVSLYDVKTANISLLNSKTNKIVQLTDFQPVIETLRAVVPGIKWKGIAANACGHGSH